MKKILLASLGIALAASSVLANEECPPPPPKKHHHHHLYRKPHYIQPECDEGAAPVIRREYQHSKTAEEEYVSTYISQHNYYGKLAIGFGYAPHMKVNNPLTNTQIKSKGRGTIGLVAVGYLFPHNIRSDLEFYFDNGFIHKRKNVMDKLQSYIGFLNLYYDFQKESRLVPFIHAGAGYARNTSKFNDGVNSYSNAQSGFAYQFGTGVSYEFRNRVYTELSYRYINKGLRKGDLKATNGTIMYKTKTTSGQVHAFIAGLRVRF